jgi:hypothetical protein
MILVLMAVLTLPTPLPSATPKERCGPWIIKANYERGYPPTIQRDCTIVEHGKVFHIIEDKK